MKVHLSQSEFCLSRRQTLSVDDGSGVRIDARAGTVWVTQDDDRRDVVLRAGESFTLDGRGRAIVQAFEPSRIALSQPAQPVRANRLAAWAARLREASRRVLPQSAWA